MRQFGIVSLLFLMSYKVFAQDPLLAIPPRDLSTLDTDLANQLFAWEAVMHRTQSFAADMTFTRHDLVTKREEKFKVGLWLMKPNMLRVNFIGEHSQESGAVLINGNTLHYYDSSAKAVVTITDISPGDNTIVIESNKSASIQKWLARLIADWWAIRIHTIIKSITAQQLVNRFDVKLLNKDANYLFFELTPRKGNEHDVFESMTVVLCNASLGKLAYMPRMILLKNANNKEVLSWDIPEPKVDPHEIRTLDFQYQAPPADWRVEVIQLPVGALARVVEYAPAAMVVQYPCAIHCQPVSAPRCHRPFRLCRR